MSLAFLILLGCNFSLKNKNQVQNSAKRKRGANGKFLPKPLLFHLRHPNSKTNQPKFWQSYFLGKGFAKTSSALFRHLPEYLEGRTLKRKKSFPSLEKIGRAQIRKARNIFSFWGCRVKRGSGGTIRAYDSVSSHHALRAWHISDFENGFELGTINTPERKSQRVLVRLAWFDYAHHESLGGHSVLSFRGKNELAIF